MSKSSDNIYCIDTSALIDLKPYPIDLFPTLWKNLDAMIKEGRLISPREVLKELSVISDDISEWAKKKKKLFRTPDVFALTAVADILKKFPTLIDPNKEIPEADPFLIAMALVEQQVQLPGVVGKYLVVTQEHLGTGGKIKIPNVCDHYGIECKNLHEFFRLEGWAF